MSELLAALEQLSPRRILVLGDVILDRYTWGAADRVSPEAPTIVLRVDELEVRLGGAAAVAVLLRGLGADVVLAGVVGDDLAGRTVRKLLEECGVDSKLLVTDAGRPTTTKERFMGRAPHRTPQQILRVDHEVTCDLASQLASVLAEQIEIAVANCEALVISDYAKGTCTPALLQAAIVAARRVDIPVIVDPSRNTPLSRYRGAHVFKPNRVEAQLATGLVLATPSDAVVAARRILETENCAAVVITLDQDGMVLMTNLANAQVFPTQTQQVTDITGAGDTAVAMIGLSLANRLPLERGVPLANLAAGLQVQRVGIVPVTMAELRAELATHATPSKIVDLPQLVALTHGYRHAGRRVVFTNGCFDLLHVGHVTYLQAARRCGDVLIVAINSDRSVPTIKGPQRPVIAEPDRAAMLAALECVDHVLVFDEPTPHSVLHALRPDILVKGGDYSVEQVVGREVVEAYGGEIRVTRHVPGVSTTQLIDRLARNPASSNTDNTVASDSPLSHLRHS